MSNIRFRLYESTDGKQHTVEIEELDTGMTLRVPAHKWEELNKMVTGAIAKRRKPTTVH